MAAEEDKARAALVMRWIAKMASHLPAPERWGETEDGKKIVIVQIGEWLCEEFPERAFTPASLACVVRKHEFFPSFKMLRADLAEWCEAAYPKPLPALTDGAMAGWSEMDRSWLAYWHKRKAENFSASERGSPSSAALVLSLLKERAPNVHGYLTRIDGAVDDGGFCEEATRATLRDLEGHPTRGPLLAAYRTLIAKRAPHLMPLLDAAA
jgi:hypothetical protein